MAVGDVGDIRGLIEILSKAGVKHLAVADFLAPKSTKRTLRAFSKLIAEEQVRRRVAASSERAGWGRATREAPAQPPSLAHSLTGAGIDTRPRRGYERRLFLSLFEEGRTFFPKSSMAFTSSNVFSCR